MSEPSSSERAALQLWKKARSRMISERTSSRVARFRQNEVLRASAGTVTGPFGFRCECAGDCQRLVVVDAFDLPAVRATPRRLVIAPDHPTEEAQIVLRRDGYLVVELNKTFVQEDPTQPRSASG
jgi:hypothetical protein